MTQTERQKARARVRFQVAYVVRGKTMETANGRRPLEGTGRVSNISKSGALLEDVDPLVMPGSSIKLRLSFLEDSIPVEIPAEVIRNTETGFGVEFKKLNPRTRAVLGMAIAKLRAAGENDEDGNDDNIPLLKG